MCFDAYVLADHTLFLVVMLRQAWGFEADTVVAYIVVQYVSSLSFFVLMSKRCLLRLAVYCVPLSPTLVS